MALWSVVDSHGQGTIAQLQPQVLLIGLPLTALAML